MRRRLNSVVRFTELGAGITLELSAAGPVVFDRAIVLETRRP